jgi:hypothetical protein
MLGNQAVKQLLASMGNMRAERLDHMCLQIKALVEMVDDALLQFHRVLQVD